MFRSRARCRVRSVSERAAAGDGERTTTTGGLVRRTEWWLGVGWWQRQRQTAMALRTVVATTTATATALRAVVVATTGGNATVGGDDDGDYERSWRCAWCLGGPWRRRRRYVVRMAGGRLSKPCSAQACGRYLVARARRKLGRTAGYTRSSRQAHVAQHRHRALLVVQRGRLVQSS